MAVRWAIVPRSARARSPAAESSKCGIGAWDQSGNARFHIVYIYVCVYGVSENGFKSLGDVCYHDVLETSYLHREDRNTPTGRLNLVRILVIHTHRMLIRYPPFEQWVAGHESR